MEPNPKPPLVSIGMPVYNEAGHIDAALRSLRAQTCRDIEIIVCDNASTDETVGICRHHAQEDPRIRVEVAERNFGSTVNFLRSLELARGEYFMWASGHDLWSPGLLAECVSLLQSHPEACIAHGSADWIGPSGEPLARESGWVDTRGMDPVGRYFTVLWGNMHPVLGVMRTQRLKSSPVPSIVGGDLVLLASLSLEGDILHAPGSRWSRRELRWETSHRQKVKRYASREFGAARTLLSRVFPLAELPLALMRVLIGSRLRWFDKLLALAALVPMLALRYRAGRRAPPHSTQ
mgnify:FL=1